MIRRCEDRDFDSIFEVINDAARAYKGVIPEDRYHEPYMPAEELRRQIDQGVAFWVCELDDGVAGVMGIQHVGDVTLIRHAYVRTALRNKGIGGTLLGHLVSMTTQPVLVGTWADASWAVRFYEKHGFTKVLADEKDRLLRKYWRIPERQVETSVVLRYTGC